MGGQECRSLVLVQIANTLSVRSDGGGWHRSKDNYRYSDMYQMSGVRWCRVVSVARPATVRLSTGTRRCGRGSMGRPSRKGLSCGWGSVARAGTSEPNGDLLEVLKGEVVSSTGTVTPSTIHLVDSSEEREAKRYAGLGRRGKKRLQRKALLVKLLGRRIITNPNSLVALV
ncbi:hypothetical protein TIFTF001_006744 [Ficus carica]|uniref:Uncharacterized protein n=1 Tax=Ficus carica TaxID=3494 RepID=A0AA87ZPM4_FICCA|nr:hypothetical protein TIFTF001_006744 [Ficus carica]